MHPNKLHFSHRLLLKQSFVLPLPGERHAVLAQYLHIVLRSSEPFIVFCKKQQTNVLMSLFIPLPFFFFFGGGSSGVGKQCRIS